MIAKNNLLAATDKFVEQFVAPYASEWEADRRMPREIFRHAASFGLTGIIVPADQGGQGGNVFELATVLRRIAATDMACAFSLVVHNNLAAAIARSNNDFLKSEFLPPMLKGEKVGAFLLTESQGGSDAAAIETRAVRKPGGYILSGEKSWVSNGIYADILSVYAQGEKGMLALVIPADLKGISRTEPYSLLGGHAVGTSGFEFSSVAVQDANVLVEEGDGLRAALAGIDVARINVAAMCCGMLEASLRYAIEFAARRKFKEQPITNMQGIQWRLADIATDLAAAEALFTKAATSHDQNGPSPVLAAQAKKFATTVAVKRIAECMQIMGAAGLLQEHPVSRHFAFAKIAEYVDGTTEIQNIVISRSLLHS